MKKIRINGPFFKHLIIILVFLRLFIFFISSISSTLVVIGSSGGFYRLNDRLSFHYYSYLLPVITLLFGLLLLYFVLIFIISIIKYIRFLVDIFRHDMWVLLIVNHDSIESTDPNEVSSLERIEKSLDRYIKLGTISLLFLACIYIVFSLATLYIG